MTLTPEPTVTVTELLQTDAVQAQQVQNLPQYTFSVRLLQDTPGHPDQGSSRLVTVQAPHKDGAGKRALGQLQPGEIVVNIQGPV